MKLRLKKAAVVECRWLGRDLAPYYPVAVALNPRPNVRWRFAIHHRADASIEGIDVADAGSSVR